MPTKANLEQILRQQDQEYDVKVSRSSTGKRKYHQKSRNGCSTCKRRRVKCDETRPACNKCLHMNLTCGYTIDSQKDELPNDDISHKRRKVSDLVSPLSLRGLPPQSTNTSPVNMSYKQASNNGQIPAPHTLLQAGHLNNLSLSHLVNNLSGLGGDLSNLGNFASLTHLAALAQLPIDLSSLGLLLDTQSQNAVTGSLDNNSNKYGENNSGNSGNSSVYAQQNNVSDFNSSRSNSFNSSKFDTSSDTKSSTTFSTSSFDNDFNDKYKLQDTPDAPVMQLNDDTQCNNDKNEPLISKSFRQDLNEPSSNVNNGYTPKISPNVNTLMPKFNNTLLGNMMSGSDSSGLNTLDLKLMYHYTTQVSRTITAAGISDSNIWNHDIPMLAFDHPFLMHSILAFSATHLSRTEKGLDQCVTSHRGDALRLLRAAVLNINTDNTDALVASALILIMDSLANASYPLSTSPKSLPASAWIFHVKGAATILTAVWPLTETSRFYKFISVDLGDLGDIINQKINLSKSANDNHDKYFDNLKCHDSEIADLFPLEIDSPYLITLAYLNKLHKERYKSDFILRIFAFPALLDKNFLSLLMTGDDNAMRIMRSYYKLLRSFTTEMKDRVWFLEGVSQVLPVDVEEYAGGAGGKHMMLDFLGGGPSIVESEIDEEITKFDPTGSLTKGLIDTNNLPSDITSNLDVMQGDSGFMNIK